MTFHHVRDTQTLLEKFHAVLEPNGILLVCDLDKEDGTFHTDGTTDIHLGFERTELQKQVQAAGFGEVTFSTPYVIRKEIKDGTEKDFPLFLMSARRR